MDESHVQIATLLRVPTDMEAAMIVSNLAAEDIDATTTGDFTAGFRAEAPGQVSILVRKGDLERARKILEELKVDPQEASHPSPESTSKSLLLIAIVALAAGAWIVLSWLGNWD
ncbi:MAG: DUF2007 domain-containing protein [Pirellulales bacterium]|nr:DUF2007 domain-containing protein [Pirellulales bacterium]